MAHAFHLGVKIEMVQQTGTDDPDNTTILDTHEYSDDQSLHMIKTQVFKKHLLGAVDAAVDELINMGLEQLGSSGKK